MKYFVTVNGKKYEVEVEADEVALTRDKIQPEEVKTISKQTASNSSNASGEIIKAPMPGKILDIKVSNGQAVKEGQLLFILEAMKMENEIVSPKSGNITGIFVDKGANVNTGDDLISIE